MYVNCKCRLYLTLLGGSLDRKSKFFGVVFFVLGSLFWGQIAEARNTPNSFANLASKLSPLVVNISTTQSVNRRQRPELRVPPGSPFEDFFNEFFDHKKRPQERRRATSLGSGFIIDPSGLVVTNNHVIADADEINVRLSDGSRFDAELVGRDPKTDLALVRFKPDRRITNLKWGNSDSARVGDWVLAIGNPFGLGGSVTAGIISARGRDIGQGSYDDFIQTDASINRGNSGGPLFNMNGEVIGINTAIFSPTGGSVGIGFAIPSSLAQNVIAQLKKYGKPRRGWLGVRIQTVTDEIAEGLGMNKAQGALIAGTEKGGPADKYGLRQGDVIISFDGKMVTEMRALPRIVAETEIGKEVTVVLWRKGKKKTIGVMIGEMNEQVGRAAKTTEDKNAPAPEVNVLGMNLSVITDEMRQNFEIEKDVTGVIVTKVEASGAASKKGIRQGDIIVEIQQNKVQDPSEVAEKVELLKKEKQRSVLLLIRQRSGDLRFVALRIENVKGAK